VQNSSLNAGFSYICIKSKILPLDLQSGIFLLNEQEMNFIICVLLFLLLELLRFTRYQGPCTGFTICRVWSWCHESSEKPGVWLFSGCCSQSGVPEPPALLK